MPPVQSAYRQGHSTETALVKVIADIIGAADCQKVTLLSLLDMSAALDSVDHTILLRGSSYVYNFSVIRNTIFPWSCWYWQNLKYQVICLCIMSYVVHCRCCVKGLTCISVVTKRMAIANGTCVSFCNQPKAHFGLPWVRLWGNRGKFTWMKRGFNACQTHRSMYPSIFNRFPVI